ncbi:TPA: hypothetical protein EYP66_02600 [Candidatus Poribacteria bacterium]|nr:hypothetical protein [Candidatus Poribacteria bacterium]
MGKKSYIRDTKGNVTAIRETSKDGRRSWQYKADNSVLGVLIYGGKGPLTEVADHHKDGTTQAYEADNSIIGGLLYDFKGAPKGKGKDC